MTAIQPADEAPGQTAAIWYYALGGQTYGPITAPALVALGKEGRLPSDGQVWRDGLTTWVPARRVPELLNLGLDACPPSLPHARQAQALIHRLEHFSVGVLVLLHFVTFGIFSMIWLNLMHGKMPQRRHDDPSAGKAIGFLFIPFYNIYWMFFTYTRLCLRLNEVRASLRMPQDVPQGLATAMCVLAICGFIPYLGILASLASGIIMIVFMCIVQSKVNEMVQAPR